jgi:hypothetical protein
LLPASAQLPATSCLGAFWSSAASARGQSVIPATKNLHTSGLMHRKKLELGPFRLLAKLV